MTPLLIVKRLTFFFFTIVGATSFTFQVHTLTTPTRLVSTGSSLILEGSASDDVCTVQILMSDTGGGHRASANALRDAFEVLHPGKIACDIVDIYTDYGPWPYNSYVQGACFEKYSPWAVSLWKLLASSKSRVEGVSPCLILPLIHDFYYVRTLRRFLVFQVTNSWQRIHGCGTLFINLVPRS